MKGRRIVVGIALAAIASVLVYAVMIALTDAPQAMEALRSFPLQTFAAMLALSMGCFVVRAVRWGWLMRLVGYPIGFVEAFYQQISGQTMTVTPGRVGEVLKPWLANKTVGMPMTRGVALVFAERVADLIAVCILSLGGLSVLRGGEWALATAAVAIVAGTALASSHWFHRVALKAVEKQAWARQHHASAAVISETIRVSLSWKTLLWSVPSSVVAWGLEGVGFALCVQALGFDAMTMWVAVSVYAISTIAGALTFLPGGIGLTEASMAGILIAAGMDGADASAATLITRVATLWWGVGLGWLTLASRPSVFRAALASADGSGGETAAEDDAAAPQ